MQHLSRVKADPTQPNLRQVHLIQAELFNQLRGKGFTVMPGELGENITTRDLDLLNLPTGTVLAIGAQAVVEITGLRNPCLQINGYQDGLLKEVLNLDSQGTLVRRAGVMGIVLRSGPVRAGDPITVHLPNPPHIPGPRITQNQVQYAAGMKIVEWSAPLAGGWQGINRLRLLPTDDYQESAATATVGVTAREFVTIAYTWSEGGKPQDGLLLLSGTAGPDGVKAVWADSWHSSPAWLDLVGGIGDDGVVRLTGSYAAPEGPDWGWQIHIGPDARITMHNVVPGEDPYQCVEAVYDR